MRGHAVSVLMRGLMHIHRGLVALLVPMAGMGRLLAAGQALAMLVQSRQRAAVKHE